MLYFFFFILSCHFKMTSLVIRCDLFEKMPFSAYEIWRYRYFSSYRTMWMSFHFVDTYILQIENNEIPWNVESSTSGSFQSFQSKANCDLMFFKQMPITVRNYTNIYSQQLAVILLHNINKTTNAEPFGGINQMNQNLVVWNFDCQ